MITLRLQANLFIDRSRWRTLAKAVVDLFDQFRTDAVVIVEKPAFSKQRGESKRVCKVLFDGVVSMVANIYQTVVDTEDFVTVGLSLNQGNQIDIAVERKGPPSS